MSVLRSRSIFTESSLVSSSKANKEHAASRKGGNAACSCGVQDVRDCHKRLAGLQRLHPDGVAPYPYFRVQENARSGVQAVLDHLHGRHVDSVNAEPDLGRFVERYSIDKIL